MAQEHDIAIIGLACRFPGALDAGQYWANLRDGVESIAFPEDGELIAAGVPREALSRPGYVKACAVAPQVENFDASFFGFTPREAASMDPQIRMFLECAHAALENAGYDPYGLPGSVGVYASGGTNRYIDLHLRYRGDASATSSFALSSLNYLDYVASTVSYKLNLRGPAITLATACSSSLVGVHLASQALRLGECDVALAGGTEVEFPVGHGYQWDEGGPMSRDGHVRPFDVKASGTVFSTGAGVVVLKRLADALADGDTVLAVVRGSAINNDGSGKAGFTAPSVAGQAAMLTEALAMAQVAPADIGYVEAHATGTMLGDPIEVAALARAFRALGRTDLPPESCALSSVKANVGHLGHAAGIASLIKATFALRHGEIPATVNFTEPNPKLELAATPFYITDRLVPWPATPGQPRYAGVSSFGVGGTNAHVVLQEPPVAGAHSPAGDRPHVVVWSAKTPDAERAYRAQLAGYLTAAGEATFPAAVSTLQEGRRAYPVRRAVVAGSAAETADALGTEGEVIEGLAARRRVVFAFPGQGAQQVAMAAGLYRDDQAFAAAMDTCLGLFADTGLDLRDAWLSGPAERLTATEAAQPLLFAVEYAGAEMLRALGVEPAAVLGHSLGEITAAAVAGIIPLTAAVGLVAARSRAMAAAPSGAMLAVEAAERDLAAQLPAGVCVAVVNAPGQTVLAGPPEQIEEAARRLDGRSIKYVRLATAGAFHSPLMSGAAATFTEAFEDVPLAVPRIAVYSGAQGGLIGEAEAADASFWAGQVAAPVRFWQALEALLSDEASTIVEVGPGQTLTAIARKHDRVADSSSVCVPLLPRRPGDKGGDYRHALGALARLWTDGVPVNWPATRPADPVRRVPLPGYQYQRRRHWVELNPPPAAGTGPAAPTASAAPGSAVTAAAAAAAGHEPAGPAAGETPFTTFSWVQEPRPAAEEDAAGHDCLLLASGDEGRDLPVIAALQAAGLSPAIARPGTAYAEVGGEFRIRPAEREDLDRVFASLDRRGITPRVLVHALGLRAHEPVTALTAPGHLSDLVDSMFALVQSSSRRLAAGRPPAVLILASRSADISGGEPLDPLKATLHGLARSLVRETPALGCRLIDVGGETDEEELAAEIALWNRHDVVALRGERRWARREEPFVAGTEARATGPGAAGHGANQRGAGHRGVPPLRRGGVYLLTGGLGGLGLAVAKGFAGTGLRPVLVLLGRTGLAAADDSDRAVRLRAQIAELESLGAQVKVIAADITDRRAVGRALDTATARFGPVTGVVHLAGVAGGGLARLRTPGQVAQTLGPKIGGTLVLAEALATRPPLDFFVCFSSRAATDGLAGSADYAAANAFQDAYATVLRRAGVRALSVNWPSWAVVGMAAEYGARSVFAELAADTCPLLDEHRINGEPVLPGTGHIDLAVAAYRELSGETGAVRLKDIVFHQVMAAPQARRVEIRSHPDGRFESWSRPLADPAADPVRHASGLMGAVSGDVPRVDLDALRGRLPDLLGADDPPRLFTLGPRWQCVARTWTLPGGDTTELLLDMEVPASLADETAGYAVHPILLDCATSAVRRPEDGPYLPFLYNALVVRDKLPAVLTAHVRRKASGPGLLVADVDLIAPDGRVIAEVSGYTMRRVEDLDFLRPAPRGADAARAWIPPAEGVRLLGTLLRCRTPGQVAVQPGARPVPAVTLPAVTLPAVTLPAVALAAPVTAAPSAGWPSAVPPSATPPAAPAVAPSPVPASAVASSPPASSVAPGGADPLEARLTAVWAEAIGDVEIGPDTDFFELGGNSLSAVGLMSSIRETFGADLSIAALFDASTIRSLAGLLREQGIR
jgi:acyl transferase domain-containing protein/acyl carrier protein